MLPRASFIAALSVVLLLSVSLPSARAGSLMKGDADCNGAVSSIDAAFVLQFSAGLLSVLPCPDSADTNSDGNVNALDAALILQFAAGLIDSLAPAPPEGPTSTPVPLLQPGEAIAIAVEWMGQSPDLPYSFWRNIDFDSCEATWLGNRWRVVCQGFALVSIDPDQTPFPLPACVFEATLVVIPDDPDTKLC